MLRVDSLRVNIMRRHRAGKISPRIKTEDTDFLNRSKQRWQRAGECRGNLRSTQRRGALIMGLFNRDWEANTMRWQILRCVGQAVICGLLMICVAAAGGQEKKAKQANDDGEARIFIGQPDGSEMKPLVDLGEYRFQSAPVWSADGTKVAFHSYRPGRGEKDADAKIVVVNADGS